MTSPRDEAGPGDARGGSPPRAVQSPVMPVWGAEVTLKTMLKHDLDVDICLILKPWWASEARYTTGT